jgi:hypothetical protein
VIGDQQFGGAVLQDKGNRTGIEAIIQRIQYRARHRHTVMRFEQCRHIRREHRNGVARPDATPAQRIGEAAAALVEFAIGETPRAINDRELVGIDRGGARQKSERRQRGEIGRIAREMRRIVRRCR